MNLFEIQESKVLYAIRVKTSHGNRWELFTYLSTLQGPLRGTLPQLLKHWIEVDGDPPRVVQIEGKHTVKAAEKIMKAVRMKILAGEEVDIPAVNAMHEPM